MRNSPFMAKLLAAQRDAAAKKAEEQAAHEKLRSEMVDTLFSMLKAVNESGVVLPHGRIQIGSLWNKTTRFTQGRDSNFILDVVETSETGVVVRLGIQQYQGVMRYIGDVADYQERNYWSQIITTNSAELELWFATRIAECAVDDPAAAFRMADDTDRTRSVDID